MTVKINGVEFKYLTGVNWTTSGAGVFLSGSQRSRTTRNLALTANVMPTTEYDQLTALEGQIITVECCGYDTVKNVTYYGCVFDSITASHVGPNMEGVNMFVRVQP